MGHININLTYEKVDVSIWMRQKQAAWSLVQISWGGINCWDERKDLILKQNSSYKIHTKILPYYLINDKNKGGKW